IKNRTDKLKQSYNKYYKCNSSIINSQTYRKPNTFTTMNKNKSLKKSIKIIIKIYYLQDLKVY
ncbi:hypothetical protein BU000_13965, partial [Mammaliicoccus sciuri]